MAVSAFLEGEYDIKECCLGVPVKIGKGGIKQIVSLALNEKEKIELADSAQKTIDTLTILN